MPFTGILTCAPRYDLGAQLFPDAGSVVILACRAQGGRTLQEGLGPGTRWVGTQHPEEGTHPGDTAGQFSLELPLVSHHVQKPDSCLRETSSHSRVQSCPLTSMLQTPINQTEMRCSLRSTSGQPRINLESLSCPP